MTELRDQFAMAALTGLLAAESGDLFPNASRYAKEAYLYADAMLEARSPYVHEPLVDDLDLSVRAANLLQGMGVRTIAELRKLTRKDFTKAGAGKKTIDEIFKISWEAGP